jgi:hypothetical protein
MSPDEGRPSQNPAVTQFDRELHETLAAHAKALYPSRTLDLQGAAAAAFAALLERGEALKLKAKTSGDEDAAARILMGECFVEGLMASCRLWIAFREGKMNPAWDWMVRAQCAFEATIRAHPAALEQARERLVHMEALEVLLFPRQAFLSTGMVIRRSKCSICGTAFGSCNHVEGRVYGGEFARRVVAEAEPREVSFVETPDDKGCRAYTIESDGVNRDVLTWDEIARDPGPAQPEIEGADPPSD